MHEQTIHNIPHTRHTHTHHKSTPIYIHAGMHERARERERARKRERESARDRGRERERTSVHTGFHSSLRMLRQTFPSCMHNNDRQLCRSKRIPYQNLISQIYPQNFRGKKRSLTTSMFGWKTYRRTKESVPVTDCTE
jgi:hypothetical protein